jgi:glycosyltransferase involved in cell wall biosynthesis
MATVSKGVSGEREGGGGVPTDTGAPEPVVSTIIPTYDGAGTLAVAAASALDQSYPEARHEVIVVDDGSPDGGAVEAALAPYRERLRLFRKARGGVASARNLGIAQARGSLLAFLDDDDVWEREKLRRQVVFLASRPGCGLVGTEFIRVETAGRVVGGSQLASWFPDERPNLYQALMRPMIPSSSMLVRREVLDEIGGFDTGLRTAEDVDFQLRVASRWGIGIVAEPLIRYRMGHQSGLSYGRGTYWDSLAVIRKHLRRHEAVLGPARCREILHEHQVRNGRGLISCGWCLDGIRLAAAGATNARSLGEGLAVAGLGPLLARKLVGMLVRGLARKLELTRGAGETAGAVGSFAAVAAGCLAHL